MTTFGGDSSLTLRMTREMLRMTREKLRMTREKLRMTEKEKQNDIKVKSL
jgi:hypothetical protein